MTLQVYPSPIVRTQRLSWWLRFVLFWQPMTWSVNLATGQCIGMKQHRGVWYVLAEWHYDA